MLQTTRHVAHGEESVAVQLTTSEETKLVMNPGSLDMSIDGMLAVLIDETKHAVCPAGLVAALCTVRADNSSIADNAPIQRRLQGSGSEQVSFIVSRSYDYASSNATATATSISDLVEAALEEQNITVASTELVSLSVSVSITVPGDAATSPVDDRFNSAAMSSALATRLPELHVTLSAPVVVTPPSPPPVAPPPLPLLPPVSPLPPLQPNITDATSSGGTPAWSKPIFITIFSLCLTMVLLISCASRMGVTMAALPRRLMSKLKFPLPTPSRVAPFPRAEEAQRSSVDQHTSEDASFTPVMDMLNPSATDKAAWLMVQQLSGRMRGSDVAKVASVNSGSILDELNVQDEDAMVDEHHVDGMTEPHPKSTTVRVNRSVPPPKRLPPKVVLPSSAKTAAAAASHTRWIAVREHVSSTYVAQRRETIADIAQSLDVPVDDLIKWNSRRFRNLSADSITTEGTKLLLHPEP